jgi:hypothetical protein
MPGTASEDAMKAAGQYDGNLQMFVEETREPSIAHLGFLRWLAERTALEHPIAGPAGGEHARRSPYRLGESSVLLHDDGSSSSPDTGLHDAPLLDGAGRTRW